MKFLNARHDEHQGHYVISKTDDGIQVAAFRILHDFNAVDEQERGNDMMAWKDLKEYLNSDELVEKYRSGFVDKMYLNKIMYGVPNAERFALQYLGRCRFSPTGPSGHSEIADHTIIDFVIGPSGLMPWSSRFIQASAGKVATTHRLRAQNSFSHGVSIFIPFVDDGPDGWTVVGVSNGKIDSPAMIGSAVEWELVDLKGARTDGLWHEEFFYHVEGEDCTISPEGLLTVELQLVSNRDGTPIHHAIELRAESTAGYLPNRRITFDDAGKASVRFRSTDMLGGEVAKIKFSTETYSNLGSITVTLT